jgi:phage terminase small subunit
VLTTKAARFAVEYALDCDGANAARRAGYAPRSAAVTASRLLKKPDVRAAVAAAQQAALAQRAALVAEQQAALAAEAAAHERERQAVPQQLTAARVLEELRRIAFADIRTLFDAQGNLRPLQDLTADEAACIAGLDVIIKNAQAGDGQTDLVHRIKCWNKTQALELLAKHFALLTEVIRVEDDRTLIAKLEAGRQRAAEAHARLH